MRASRRRALVKVHPPRKRERPAPIYAINGVKNRQGVTTVTPRTKKPGWGSRARHEDLRTLLAFPSGDGLLQHVFVDLLVGRAAVDDVFVLFAVGKGFRFEVFRGATLHAIQLTRD